MALMPRTFTRALLPARRVPPGPKSMIKAPWPVRRSSAAAPRSAEPSYGRASDSQGCADEDLAAVGAVSAPSSAGISFDPEPVMDLGVVPFADQPGVLQAGVA